MQASEKAIVQNPEGRGILNNNYKHLSNFENEITFNIYHWNGDRKYPQFFDYLRFQTIEDAYEYLAAIGATEGTEKNKEYYSLQRVDGCCFLSIAFYSVK